MTGSDPSTLRESVCSDTAIVPSSAAKALPTRPAQESLYQPLTPKFPNKYRHRTLLRIAHLITQGNLRSLFGRLWSNRVFSIHSHLHHNALGLADNCLENMSLPQILQLPWAVVYKGPPTGQNDGGDDRSQLASKGQPQHATHGPRQPQLGKFPHKLQARSGNAEMLCCLPSSQTKGR